MRPLPYCLCNCASQLCVRIRPFLFLTMTTQHPQGVSLARTLSAALADPYSNRLTPYPHQPPPHNVNPQGYTYSSTYNPLTYSTSYTSFNVSSASSRNSFAPRGAPQTHWYTPGQNKCTYSGCTFSGSANSLQIHMMDRHLIHPPGWHARKRRPDWDADPSLKGCVLIHTQSEIARSLTVLSRASPAHRKPVPILGTNVRLDTPEELAAWIAERRRLWPTAARVAEKKRKLDKAMANGGLLPEHLMLTGGNKRFRPPPPSDVGVGVGFARSGRGRGGGSRSRGRGRGAGGQNRTRGISGPRGDVTSSAQTQTQTQTQTQAQAQAQAQPSPLPVPAAAAKDTDPRPSVQSASVAALSPLGSDADTDSGSDNDAPEVLSAKRPPGIEAYASSSDVKLEPPQPDNGHSQPDHSVPLPPISGPATIVGSPSTLAKAVSTNAPRRAPPPQPKRPPRNPFAPRSSLLRNVSNLWPLVPVFMLTVGTLVHSFCCLRFA